jgi:hypothetical protein
MQQRAAGSFLLLVVMLLLPEHGSRLEATPALLVWLLVVSGLTLLASTYIVNSNFRELTSIVVLVIVMSVGAVNFNVIGFTWPNIQFIPDNQQRAFGNAISSSVPSGQVVAGDPVNYWLRMNSGVGYAVDCKFRPIGGGEPLAEFYRRLDPIGGYESACRSSSFLSVSASDLDSFAKVSASELLLLETSDGRISDLLLLGWRITPSPDLERFSYVLLTQEN